jgi:hypothetical protein
MQLAQRYSLDRERSLAGFQCDHYHSLGYSYLGLLRKNLTDLYLWVIGWASQCLPQMRYIQKQAKKEQNIALDLSVG